MKAILAILAAVLIAIPAPVWAGDDRYPGGGSSGGSAGDNAVTYQTSWAGMESCIETGTITNGFLDCYFTPGLTFTPGWPTTGNGVIELALQAGLYTLRIFCQDSVTEFSGGTADGGYGVEFTYGGTGPAIELHQCRWKVAAATSEGQITIARFDGTALTTAVANGIRVIGGEYGAKGVFLGEEADPAIALIDDGLWITFEGGAYVTAVVPDSTQGLVYIENNTNAASPDRAIVAKDATFESYINDAPAFVVDGSRTTGSTALFDNPHFISTQPLHVDIAAGVNLSGRARWSPNATGEPPFLTNLAGVTNGTNSELKMQLTMENGNDAILVDVQGAGRTPELIVVDTYGGQIDRIMDMSATATDLLTSLRVNLASASGTPIGCAGLFDADADTAIEASDALFGQVHDLDERYRLIYGDGGANACSLVP